MTTSAAEHLPVTRSAGPGAALLLVDKPADMTSHDVVAIARRTLGERRIGHHGTLDPFATGLLVLLVGRATRLAPWLDGEPKVYRATIRFGAETETDDLHGAVTREAAPPDEGAVADGIRRLTGHLMQRPPSYSAKRVGGVRAYAAARRGEALELAPVPVHVHAWHVESQTPDEVVARITCGSGTYIRALARDLGRLTGSAAHLVALRRLRSGPFDVAEAVTVERLRAGEAPLRSPLDGMTDVIPVQLDAAGALDVAHGRGVAATAAAPGSRGALLAPDGRLVAVAEREGGRWRPRVVLLTPEELARA